MSNFPVVSKTGSRIFEQKTKNIKYGETMEEDRGYGHQRMVKRRLMDAQNGSAEVRRLHIVYFLCRKGRIEHPHLVRVHHHSRNGVRLRDIKRWLGELRGKDMPQLFAWSYKRKYKAGYVWQDLLDDDLITPIADNEYVLKGSEVSSTLNKDFACSEKQLLTEPESREIKNSSKEEKYHSHSSEASMYISTKSSSEIEEESPTFSSETSTLTDDTSKPEMEKGSDSTEHKKPEAEEKIENPFYTKKNKRKSTKVKINEKANTTASVSASASSVSPDNKSSSPPSSEKNGNKSKSRNSNGPTNVFRNLISCGTSDANDSAVVMVNKQNRPFMNMCSSDERNVRSTEICKREKLGGSQRILGNPIWTQHPFSGRKSCDGVKDATKNKSDFRDQKGLYSAAYKPVNGPNCSQCGKQFKPEKLHSHMKSCKGMKAVSKGAAANPATAEASRRSTESHKENAVSGYILAR